MKLTRKKTYSTTYNYVEYKGTEYLIKCCEDELEDTWEIYYKHERWIDPIELDINSDLGDQLITFCKNQ
jgi:hypothetical protein